jgi:hypothetical protein
MTFEDLIQDMPTVVHRVVLYRVIQATEAIHCTLRWGAVSFTAHLS